MIKQLEIKNFQSHRDTCLDFVPGVNVIVGKSQSGKTAILRALQWVCFNRPRGNRFVSIFSKNKRAFAKVEFDNEVIVELSKTKNETIYSLKKKGEGKVFKKFSSDVPDLVREAINLGSINIQNQLEEPFLVLDNGGRIAQEIAKITQIEKVDKWLSALNSMYLKTNQNVKFLKKEKEEISKKLKKLKNLDVVQERLQAGEKIERKLNLSYQKWRFLSDWLNEFEMIKLEIEKLSSLELIDEKRKKIDLIFDEYRELMNKLLLFNEFLKCCDLIFDLENKLEIVEKGETIVQKLCELIEKEDIFAQILEIEDIIKEKEDELFNLKQRYIEMLRKAKRCPFCLSVISEEQLSHIEREI